MTLTRSFKETVQARVQRDPAFRAELLREGVDALLAGDLGTAKAILRDCINATGGFEALSAATGTPTKSLMRMLGPRGNPQASNLVAILRHLQDAAGLQLQAKVAACACRVGQLAGTSAAHATGER